MSVRRGRAGIVDLGLLGVALVWGSSYLAAKIATGLSPVPVVLLGRYGLSAVACVPLAWAAARYTGKPLVTRSELKAGLLLGSTQALVLALETWGVAGTSAVNAGVLISFTIILTPLIEAVLGAWLPRHFYLAAGLSIVGIIVLTGSGGLTGLRVGDLLVLAAAIVRGGHVVLIGRVSARSRERLRPLHLTMVQAVVGAAWMLPLAVPDLGGSSHVLTNATFWAAIAYLGLGCTVFAFLAQTYGVQRTSASRASLLLGTEPVWAVVVSLTIGGERLTAVALTGCLLILASCWWGQSIEAVHRSRRERTTTTDTETADRTTTYDALVTLLDAHRADYTLIDHERAGATGAVSARRGHLLEQAAKCLLIMVKVDRHTRRYVLAVVPGDRTVDLAAIKALYGGRYVGFCDPATAERLARTVPGTVLPFAMDPEVNLVADPDVLRQPQLYFNAARLDRSVCLATSDYQRIAQPQVAPIATSPAPKPAQVAQLQASWPFWNCSRISGAHNISSAAVKIRDARCPCRTHRYGSVQWDPDLLGLWGSRHSREMRAVAPESWSSADTPAPRPPHGHRGTGRQKIRYLNP